MLNPNSECLHTIRDKIAAGFYQNRVRVLAEAGSDDAEIQRESWAKQDKICFDNFFKDLVDELVLDEDCNNSLQHVKNVLWNMKTDFQCNYQHLLKYACDLLILKDADRWLNYFYPDVKK
jgi:hypothetical protein